MTNSSESGSSFEHNGSDRDADSESQASSGESLEDEASESPGTVSLPGNEIPLKRQKAYIKAKRLAGHYNFKYIDLLNEDIVAAASPFANLPRFKLDGSQFGGSWWSPQEKNKFFEALARFGRDDLPKIADAIGTKSPLEVRLYLVTLQKGLVEQGLNAVEHKLLSWADVPAAAEVGESTEERLDLAAEALASKLWSQDAKREQGRWGTLWCIDQELSGRLDKLVSEEKRGRKRSRAGNDEGAESPSKRQKAHNDDLAAALLENEELQQAAELFHTKAWIMLQHNIFMNAGGRRSDENWRSIATDEEVPAMLCTAYTDFYRLTRSLTQRLIHAAQFQSMTRQRAIDRGDGIERSYEVERVDVVASLKSLSMPLNGNQFWAHTARRCGVQVTNDTRTPDIATLLGYDEVEAELLGRSRAMEHHANEDTPESELLTPADVKEMEADEDLEEYAEALDGKANHEEEQKLLIVLGEKLENAQEPPFPERPKIRRKAADDLVDWRDWTEYQAFWE